MKKRRSPNTLGSSAARRAVRRQVLEDLDSHADISRLTDRLLKKADAYGTFPTPVSEIVAAADLTEVPESMLSSASIAEAPAHLRAALRRVRGKVHALLDRREREVHINPETDRTAQRAFKRLHETAHELFPWQHVDDGRDGFADDTLSLSPKTTNLFEREANQGAAELLFQRLRFAEMAADYRIGCAAIAELAEMFGASKHATFRRYVETHHGAVAGIVLEPRPYSNAPLAFRRHEAICSPAWTQRFEDPLLWPNVLGAEPFGFVQQARACSGFGSPQGTWGHIDLNNEVTSLEVEAMSNSYRTFVLIWLPRRELFKRRRVLVAAA
jgi:hypothetical protein